MNTIAYAKQSLEQATQWAMALITDMKDSPMTAPAPNGGNHPLWVFGHLVLSESRIVYGFLEGKESPLNEWAPLFRGGTQPVDDASRYPSFDEIATALETTRAHTLKVLEGLTDEALDRPSHAPEERKAVFGTVGQVVAMLSLHWTFHAGQVADARRAAGKPPLFG